jgi:2-(1,2-epoxy-1,2-dihydrophenyl)acetyl-CoA isomerase
MTAFAVDRNFGTVQIQRRGAAARIVLDRPESLNAWDMRLAGDLREAIAAVGGDASIRAVGLTGAGRGFSTGADLRDVLEGQRTEQGSPDLQRLLTEHYNPLILGLRELEKPVVAEVNGPAVGVGASLALAADLILARESAYFLMAFINIGLALDGGASAFLAARVGAGRAARMAMLGERVSARQALEWGLIDEIADDDEFADAADALLERLAAGPTRAHAQIKRQLNAWVYAGLPGHLGLESAAQQAAAETRDFAEGVDAFLAKRRPSFGGE